MFKIAICDDDRNYWRVVKETVSRYSSNIKGIAFYEYSSGEELLADTHQIHNLLFLDIQMAEMDGNEAAKEFRAANKSAVLVFCTNYQEPTTESFKVQPYRYIMKDFSDRMLTEEMPDILNEMMARSEILYLTITEDGKVSRIPIDQILYVSMAKRGAVIHKYSNAPDKETSCRETVGELYGQLSEMGFAYAHNSYIVNMANIIHISKTVITLKDNTELNISRSRKVQFDEAFSNFLHKRYKRR